MSLIAGDPAAGRDALHRGALVLTVSVVAGLLLAVLAFPVIGGFGLLARAGADSFGKLPAELEDPPPPQRSKILAADGTTLADIYFNENRIVVPLRRVPQHMQLAILAIEDERFYEHGGVDLRGLLRALVRNSQAGGVRQGGSTITQQYVKNVLIEAATDERGKRAAVERSTTRKIREARYAIAMERKYSKRQILEKYLNIAYFGSGVYGVGTAAQHYFSVPVERLTLPQAALLAGMVKNPTLYNPVKNPKTSRARRDLVLRRMHDVGFVDARALRKALATAVRITESKLTGFSASRAPYFLDYLQSTILDDRDGTFRDSFGETIEERAQKLFQGGLTIHTTLDPKLQAVAQRAIDTTIPRAPPVCDRARATGIPAGTRCVASAAVVVQPATGQVRAMAVDRDYARYQVNLATGSGGSGFQAGSTFKAFTLAAAIEQGLPLGTRIFSPARYRPDPAVCNAPRSGYFSNADPAEAGVFDIPRATWLSVNTFYVQLEERVGVLRAAAMARRLGVTTLPDTITRKDCSFTLGAHETTPLDMAAAYATLANRGVRCRPTPVDRVVDAQGRDLFKAEPACERAVEQQVADAVTAVLEGVIGRGTGRGAAIGRPAAGKTGTTQSFGAAWFVGYTPDYATAVWMGDTRGPAYPLRNVFGRARVYGGSFPATIWQKLMSGAVAGLPVRRFPPVPASAYLGERVPLPDVVGYAAEEAVRRLTEAGFVAVVSPARVAAAPIPAGYVGATSPAPHTPVAPGTTVVVHLSDGSRPRPSPSRSTAPPGSPSPTPSPRPSASPSPTGPGPSPSPSPSPTCRPGQGQGNGDRCPTPGPPG